MSSHLCDTRKVAFQDRWLLIGGSFVYKMSFWGTTKWPPIGGWLLIRVAAHSRFYCTIKQNVRFQERMHLEKFQVNKIQNGRLSAIIHLDRPDIAEYHENRSR